jgi:hypothetical protein
MKKSSKKKKKTHKKAKTANIEVIEVEDEALDEDRAPNKKGPANTSRAHFKTPVPVTINRKPRWEFGCKYCSR